MKRLTILAIVLVGLPAICGAAVERDGLIITGRDPRAASQFGQAVADALQVGD